MKLFCTVFSFILTEDSEFVLMLLVILCSCNLALPLFLSGVGESISGESVLAELKLRQSGISSFSILTSAVELSGPGGMRLGTLFFCAYVRLKVWKVVK
jgi:hypothetical protein